MRQYLTIVALLLVAMSFQDQAFAQEEKNTQYRFKVYYNFNYINLEIGASYQDKSSHFGAITPSFVISKPRVSHEIEISQFNIKKNYYDEGEISSNLTSPRERKSLQLQWNMRYEYAINILKIKRYQLSVAASAEPYLDFFKYTSLTPADFPSKLTIIGNKFHLIPRATFALNDKLFIDVNIPIEIMNTYKTTSYLENPAWAEENRRISYTRSNFFDSVFRFRVGLGFNL